MFELIILASFALVPAAVIAFASVSVRRFLFVLGLFVGLGFDLIFTSGPDSQLLIFPLAGFGISVGALIVEIIGWLRRIYGQRSEAT